MKFIKDKNIEKQLGRLFQKGRVNKGLTQATVCKALGYSSSQFLSNFERGMCAMPLSQLRKLIDLYDLDGNAVVDIIVQLQQKYLRFVLAGKRNRPQKV